MRHHLLAVIVGFGAIVIVAGGTTRVSGAQVRSPFVVDVLEDCNTFVQNPPRAPLTEERGDLAIVSGAIYPGGTFPIDMANPHDPPVNLPAIGRWLSRAVFLLGTDAFNAGGSPIVFATMSYEFPGDSRSLMSEGMVPNMGLHTTRAIIGGTGIFSGARGEVRHDNIGFNSTGCFNYRFTFKLADER